MCDNFWFWMFAGAAMTAASLWLLGTATNYSNFLKNEDLPPTRLRHAALVITALIWPALAVWWFLQLFDLAKGPRR